MATKIIHKKSSTGGSVPAANTLEPGELAVNLADKKIYSKQTDGTVIEMAPNTDQLALSEICKNVSGGSLAIGTPVYQSGTAGNAMEVQAARADTASSMPVIGIITSTLADDAEGTLVLSGFVQGLDTSTFSEGDTLYVGVTGGLTTTTPTGEANLIQNIGRVIKVHASNGSIMVTGAGRSNATPNLDNGDIFIGNGTNQAVTASLSTEVDTIVSASYLPLTGGILTGDFTITDTTDDSAAGPELSLARNSTSPADGDYLGQLRFDGKSDTGTSRLYAKMTGKTADVSNGAENGLIETAVMKAGTQTIVARQTHDALKLINGTGLEVAGNITVTGTVDGRDVAADGTKLDGVEASATADQTDAEIRAAVEAASDSNVFTDADHTKLNGIEASATADQTGAEIKAAYEAETSAFTDAQFTKLSNIETNADVTDATNVTAAGALMDSEVTNLAQVKSFDSSDYATAAQGTTADAAMPKSGGAFTGAVTTNSTIDGVDIATRDGVLTSTTTTANAALPKAGGAMTGAITTNSTFDGRDVAADGTKLDGIAASANNYVHPNHSGEVTSSADGATTIADDVVDEANLKVSNAPTNGYVLTAQSGETGGLTWASASSGGIASVVEDTTPQMGGTLDMNGNHIDMGDWTITEASNALYFAYQGTNKMKLLNNGDVIFTGNVTAYGTIT